MHKLGTPRLAFKWHADGYLTLTAFGSCEEEQPKAMKRHLLEWKSLGYFLCKEEALTSYIQENEGAYDRRYS